MKIYFSGAHSCGKSTLSRYVSSKYNLPIVTETARMILSEQELQIDQLRCDPEIANNYQRQVFKRQILEESKYTSFVADRSIIDILAYSAQHSKILPELMGRPELTAALESLKMLDVILFFIRPTKATLRSDGVREILNWDSVIAIDAMLKLLFEMFEIKYFQINADSIQERTKLIDNIINIKFSTFLVK